MELIFWVLLVLTAYCYFGYPLLLGGIAKCFPRRPKKGKVEPTVSLVLSVWNEEDVIKRRIENFLSLNYPAEKCEILIRSDGSTDKTVKIIEQFNDPRIHLIVSDQREGKMVALNALVEEASNEIVIFTDARQVFDEGAIKALVNNFADTAIGCVSGELILRGRRGRDGARY